MPRKIEISHRTIIFTVFFLLFLGLLYYIKDIILQFFIAVLIMAILDPFVTKLQIYKIPRGASVLIAYLVMLTLISLAIAGLVPAVVEQTTAFVNNLPRFLGNIGVASFINDRIVNELLNQLATLPGKAVNATLALFSNFLNIIAILVFAFYLLAERDDLKKQIANLIGEKKEAAIEKNFTMVENKLGAWARGQLSLMVVVGITNYIGLSLLGIPYALPLSILAGLLEIIPYIGPILAAIPAVLIGFGISPLIGWAAAALSFLIQQLENYVLVPKIMQKSTGINPIITLLVLAIGARLAGFVGLLISVPVYIIIQVILQQYFAQEADGNSSNS